MKKEISELIQFGANTNVLSTTQYAGGIIYENGVLEMIPHAEGYTQKDPNGNYQYVYQYKDHLGNIRLSYADADNSGTVDSSEILSEKHYYPFGLTHKGYGTASSENATAHRFGYTGKEFNDELGLEWYDITARNYDPAIGRWMNIDPLAELMRRHSPYNYAFDNPIYFMDPDGMAPSGGCPPGECCDCNDNYEGESAIVGDGAVNQLDEVVITGKRTAESNSTEGDGLELLDDSMGGDSFANDSGGSTGDPEMNRKGGRNVGWYQVAAVIIAITAYSTFGLKTMKQKPAGDGKTNATNVTKKTSTVQKTGEGVDAFKAGYDVVKAVDEITPEPKSKPIKAKVFVIDVGEVRAGYESNGATIGYKKDTIVTDLRKLELLNKQRRNMASQKLDRKRDSVRNANKL